MKVRGGSKRSSCSHPMILLNVGMGVCVCVCAVLCSAPPPIHYNPHTRPTPTDLTPWVIRYLPSSHYNPILHYFSFPPFFQQARQATPLLRCGGPAATVGAPRGWWWWWQRGRADRQGLTQHRGQHRRQRGPRVPLAGCTRTTQ